MLRQNLFRYPVTGKGFDAIWGYISVESDGETIAGAIFDHKAETPGLGAEINKDEFENQFIKNRGVPLKLGLPHQLQA